MSTTRTTSAARSFFGFVLVILGALQANGQMADSLDIKIGQMLLIGFPGPEVDPQVLEEVRAGKVGSIILFEKNIPPRNSFIALKKIAWTYQQAAAIPLFICIDQEGGRVNRLKEKYGFPRSITAAAMGKSHSLDTVRIYAEATAATLAGLGINVNFAPVVDLASNPDNPIIARYGRAFSADQDSVALLAREFIKAHRRFNVITALKHFPGHGSSKNDTHLGIADVTNTWEPRELKPYSTLIDSGYVDAIMSAHIVNMKLDKSGHPGTLSKPILSGILRDSLHYDGVVFSDDMQMHAITEQYGLKDAIRLAILAGIDIMTFSNNIAGSDKRTADTVHALIREMVKSGEIPERRIDASFERIMKLKNRLASPNDPAALMRELRALKLSLERATDLLQDVNQKLEDKATQPEEKESKRKRQK